MGAQQVCLGVGVGTEWDADGWGRVCRGCGRGKGVGGVGFAFRGVRLGGGGCVGCCVMRRGGRGWGWGWGGGL